MRTTLNIADDVLCAVRERAHREGRSSGEVLSEVARLGLMSPEQAGEVAESGAFYGFEPLPTRGAVISNNLIDQLREEDPV
jgi:hypothetical protein